MIFKAKTASATVGQYYSGVNYKRALHYKFIDDSGNILLNEGDTITSTALLSVSSVANVACIFAENSNKTWPYIYLEVEPLKDTLAVDVASLSKHDEKESIYPPNVKFNVTKIEKVAKNPYCEKLDSGYVIHIKELKSSIDYKKNWKRSSV